MKKKLTILIGTLAIVSGVLLGIWYFQANYAERLRIINVPQWIAGDGNVSYSVAVGKSQINPFGTVWKMTVGDGRISNLPICTTQDYERYLARHK